MFTDIVENVYSPRSLAGPEMHVSVTIKDVAREAQVSVATVSRALNGHDNVAAAVRARVLQVASDLRYSPHHAARSLSSRRTSTIGVVLPDLHGEFFSELMRGIDLVARERGLHLLVSSCHGNPVEQGAAMLAMRGRVDGLLVMSPSGAADVSDADPLPGLPAVLINTPATIANTHGAISIDNHGGALAMMRHLHAAGHARIAFIAGPQDNFDARERRRGYLEALASGGGHAPWIVDGDFSESSGCRAGEQMLAASVSPDAVFAANDMMALGCLYAFNQAGVRVPQDIALAGFDDIPLARYVHPALTTMRVDISDLGGRALRLLLDGIADPSASSVQSIRLPTWLVVRDSSPATNAQAARALQA